LLAAARLRRGASPRHRRLSYTRLHHFANHLASFVRTKYALRMGRPGLHKERWQVKASRQLTRAVNAYCVHHGEDRSSFVERVLASHLKRHGYNPNGFPDTPLTKAEQLKPKRRSGRSRSAP